MNSPRRKTYAALLHQHVLRNRFHTLPPVEGSLIADAHPSEPQGTQQSIEESLGGQQSSVLAQE